MADDKQETEMVETPPEQPAQTASETPADVAAELERTRAALKAANAESAARRKRLEELETAEQKRKEAELSEMERLQKQLEDAQAKAARMERESAQRAAADEAGLPAAFADRIKGETPDAMLADAKSLLEAMPKQAIKPNLRTTNPGGNASTVGETDKERMARLFGSK